MLNTLRYIHANPKAAQMQAGYFYDFSNYGIHDRLTDDGLTQWHPAFLALGNSLDNCAKLIVNSARNINPNRSRSSAMAGAVDCCRKF